MNPAVESTGRNRAAPNISCLSFRDAA